MAQTEGRLTRRLARYWVFLVLASLFGLLAYFYYSAIHAFGSAFSPSIGLLNPRYLVSAIGSSYLTGFILGIVFLGFDVRARDVRENIVEVLDSRPMTNLELVAGRFLGLFINAWVPVVVLVILVQLLGWLLPLLGSPVGRTIEPLSLMGFVVFMAIPGIAFCFALVFLITLLVRHRLVAAVVTIAVVSALYWGTIVLPAVLVPFVDFLGLSQLNFPSDIVPSVARPGSWLQRTGFFIVAMGMIGLAAVVHPRLDEGNRGKQSAVSVGLVIIGLLLVAGTWQQRLSDLNRAEGWQSAHAARADEPYPDILSIKGAVAIDPGESLAATLEIAIQAPMDQALGNILLTLNPGLEIEQVSTAAGQPLENSQTDGLLEIKLPLAAGEKTSLILKYHGRPETAFAYLDSSLKLENLKMTDAQVGILGYAPGIFDRRYVALMPGIYWLPAAGVDVGRDDNRKRQRDYFDLDLEVEVPSAWTVAGPGKREELGADQARTKYHFTPGIPIPEVAIVAAEFKSYSTEIDGITFEFLVHPGHDRNFEILAESRTEVEQWIKDHLDVAREAGLAYPFTAFTLVEAPTTLRGYEGGWRLNTALAPPAMMLLRESSFPTARFDFDIGNSFGNKRDFDQEGGKGRIDRDRLVNFFYNDVSGGNLFAGAANSFYMHRTSAFGPDAIALDFTMEQLATLLLSGQRSYFSAHMFVSINQSVTSVIGGLQGRPNIDSIAEALTKVNTSKPEVWDAVLQTSLADIDPNANPQRTIDVLTLKGGEMAQAIYDTLGPEVTGKVLGNILARHQGRTFSRDDVIAAGASVTEDLGSLFQDWFGSNRLPGFFGDNVQRYRLPDTDNGDSAYQLLLRVRNDEPVTGFARVSWYFEAFGEEHVSEPFRVNGHSAVEFGVVLSEPPLSIHLLPYLSLNRGEFTVKIMNEEEIPNRKVEPFNGIRDVPWDTHSDDRIIADDLDAEFSIVKGDANENLRLLGRGIDVGTDQGLPIAIGQAPPSQWSRRDAITAWGRYRHTAAYIRAGNGNNRAVMPATIPEAGVWELEVHIPWLPGVPEEQRGAWDLEIVSENGRESVNYNSRVGVYGWNLVGEYQLPAGTVKVEFTDKTDGRAVIADAIAWSPVNVRNNDEITNE